MPVQNLTEFRNKYPQYADVPPVDLAKMMYDANPEFQQKGVDFDRFADAVGVRQDMETFTQPSAPAQQTALGGFDSPTGSQSALGPVQTAILSSADMMANQAQADYRSALQAGEPDAEPPGLISDSWNRGVNQLQATGYGALGLTGSAIGSDKLRDYGFEGYQRNIEEAQQYPKRVESFRDIDSVGKAGTWAGETLVELAPSMLEAGVTSMAGAALGTALSPGAGTVSGGLSGFIGKRAIKKLIEKTAAQYVKKNAKKKITKEAAEELAKAEVKKIGEHLITKKAMQKLGAQAGIVAGVAPVEAGGNWAELLEEHGIDNPVSALATGIAAGFVELAGGNARLIGKVLGEPAKEVFDKAVKAGNRHIISRMAIEAAKQAPGEFAQESTQEFLSMANIAWNDPDFELFTKENGERILESGMAGGLAGLAGGFAGGVKASPDHSGGGDSTKPQTALGQALSDPSNFEKKEPEIIIPERDISMSSSTDAMADHVHISKATAIDTKAQEAATSQQNDKPQPTDEQIKAGNYEKAPIMMRGLQITIENPDGSIRQETKPDDAPDDWQPSWQTKMNGHYGYFNRTEGKDGDQVDVFIRTRPDTETDKAYIVDQVNPETGDFDEHKVIMGASNEAEAEQLYLSNYEDGWQGLGAITEVPIDKLKRWLKKGKQKTSYSKVLKKPGETNIFDDETLDQDINLPEDETAGIIEPAIGAPIDQAAQARAANQEEMDLMDEEGEGEPSQTALGGASQPGAVISSESGEVGPGQAEALPEAEDYEQRYENRMKQIELAMSAAEIDSIINEEHADKERHFHGTSRIESAAKKAKEEIKEKEILEQYKQDYHAGKWVMWNRAASTSSKGADQEAAKLNKEDPKHEYRAENWQDGFGSFWAIRRRKKPDAKSEKTPGIPGQDVVAGGVDSEPGGVVGDGEKKKPAITKRGKALQEYNEYLQTLTDEQKQQAGDLIVENPKSPSIQKVKIQKALQEKPAEKPKTPEKPIGPNFVGKNPDGETLYQDENGVRYKYERGLKVSEPVAMIPTREGIKTEVDRSGSTIWRTVEEVEAEEGVKTPEKPKMTFEEFEKEYRTAFENSMKYSPDQAGSTHYTEKMAELAEAYPEWAEKAENNRKADLETKIKNFFKADKLPAMKKALEKGEMPNGRKLTDTDKKMLREEIEKIEGELKKPATEPKVKDPAENAWRNELTGSGRYDVAKAAGFNDKDAGRISKTLWRHIDDAVKEKLTPHLTQEAVKNEVIPHDGWETHLIKARSYAKDLGVDFDGSDNLETVVGKIKKHLSGETKTEKPADEFSPDNLLAEWDKQAETVSAKEKAQEVKQHLSNAMDKFKQINDILGNKGNLSNQPIDENKYQQIKPLLQAALDDILQAGKSAAEFVKLALENLSTNGKPYFKRFVKNDMKIVAKSGENDYINNREESPKKESDNGTTDNIRGQKPSKPTAEDDRGSAESQSAEDVSGNEKVQETTEVSEGSGTNADVSVQPGSKPDNSRSSQKSESKPDQSESTAGNEPETGLEGNSGNVSRFQRSDYTIKPGTLDREGGWKKAAENNLDAVELLKKINSENRKATQKEQETLAKYVGWGSSELANKMFPGYSQQGEVMENWADSEWKPLVVRLKELLTPEEIKTAAKSTQYAHYTSEPIVRSIYKALSRMGFEGGKILEPGMGIGNFIGLLPAKMRKNSVYTGVEMDHVSAGIAKLLYPNQNILQADFTKQSFPPNFFDAAIGNPPFGSTKILADPEYRKNRFSLHNYFFAKAIDRVKPGGLLVFVTSRYSMDSKADKARKYLAARADLLGAIRLPQTAFKKSAGTEVVTDVLFFQKRDTDVEPGGQAWTEQKEVTIGDETVLINEYFVDHPEMVLGKHSLEGSMYVSNTYTVTPIEGEIEDHFAHAIKKLPSKIYQKVSDQTQETFNEKAVIERDFDPKNKKEGGLYISDKGRLMKVDFGSGVPASSIHGSLTAKDKSMLKSYIKLRDALKLSHKAQLDDGDWETALKDLNREYDKFVKKHGRILAFSTTVRTKKNEDGTTEKVEYQNLKNLKNLKIDTEYPLVLTLEKIKEDGTIIKSPVLEGRTINRPKLPDIKSIPDALAVSLDAIGKLDVNHIAKISGKAKEEVITVLGDLIYNNPDGSGYVMADEYLAGNVVRKLEEAKAAAKLDKQFDRNVDALEKSQPEPLKPENITVTPGVPWIPLKYYSEFATDAMGMPPSEVTHQSIDNSWYVTPEKDTRPSWQRYGDKRGYSPQGLRSASNEWGTEDRGPNEIYEAVLNKRPIRITRTYRENGVTKTETDVEATAAANEIAKRIRTRFNSWVWEDADRASELLDIYNKKINVIKGREFDGSHLTLPGMSQHFKPYDHQKRGIWRIIQSGNTYLAHAVGAGKTAVMISAGMEMRRLGFINKPLYVVPNHMLGQFAQEFQELYPMANILVADEENFHTHNRKRFVAKAAMNNPDAVILTHSSFGLLGVQETTLAPVRDEFLNQLRQSLEEMEDEDVPRMRIKRMEKRIEQAEQRFDSMIADGDNVVSFEELGTDFLFVDEAHEFRKLDFVTNQQLKGIDPNGSKRAIDLFIKTLWMEKQNPGRSHVFASGTPITNTLGELYSLQRFFAQDEMEADGIDHFDSWSSMFGEAAVSYEMNSAGRYEPVERFSKFVNLPELMTRVRMFMDVLTSSQLGTRVERPAIKGGTPELVLAPRNEALTQYQDNVLQPRIKTSREWKPSKEQPGNPDPMINIITDGKLAAVDMRFVDPKAKNDPDSKLNKYIDGIIEAYNETKDNIYSVEYGSDKQSPNKGGAQICFYNVGFGQGVMARRGFNSKAFLVERLKKAGIPESRIGWIDDYKTAPQKQALFKAVRDGKKRILLGSSKKMGTGVNAQNRLTHLHYLDAPWYPADVEQPDGRIIRQGNQNKEVTIKRYATKGSYDSTMWQMVARKSKFIEQAFVGDKNVRSIEDLSETSQYEMAAAIASGDERVIHLVSLNADIERLSMLESSHYNNQRALSRDKRKLIAGIENGNQRLDELRELEEFAPDYIGPEISGKIGRTEFEKRKEFGESLVEKILKTPAKIDVKKWGIAVKLGEISGFEIKGIYNFYKSGKGEQLPWDANLNLSHDGKLLRVGDRPFTEKEWIDADPVGLTKKITNAINGIPTEISQIEKQVSEQEKELSRVNKKLGAPYEHAKELAEKVSEAAILERELAAEGEPVDDGTITEISLPDDEEGPQMQRTKEGASTVSDAWNKAAEEVLANAGSKEVVYLSDADFKNTVDQHENLYTKGFTNKEDIKAFYSPVTQKIYINKDKASKEAIFHEYTHPVLDHIRATNPKLYEAGIKLVKDTPYYQEAIENKYKDPLDEALVIAIGRKGAEIQDSAMRGKFLHWLNRVFIKAKKLFKKAFNLKPTIDDFAYHIANGMRKGIFKASSARFGSPAFQVEAYHGSPHHFDRFSLEKIGTGEGAQAFGWGLYFTEKEDIARYYARSLATYEGEKLGPKIDELDSWELNSLEEWLGDNGQNVWSDYEEMAKAKGVDWSKINYDNMDDVKKDTIKTYLGIAPNWLGGYFPGNTSVFSDYTEEIRQWLEDQGYDVEKPSRNLYKVTLHKGKDPSEYTWLDWEQPVSDDNFNKIVEQLYKEAETIIPDPIGPYGPKDKKEFLKNSFVDVFRYADASGDRIYRELSRQLFNGDKETSIFLLRAGIDGIRYPVGSLTGNIKSDKKNYVVFDENAVEIENNIQFQRTKADKALTEDIDFQFKANTDMGRVERSVRPPHWIAKRYKQFKALYDRQHDRDREKNTRLYNSLKEAPTFWNMNQKKATKMANDVVWVLEGHELKDLPNWMRPAVTDEEIKQWAENDDEIMPSAFNDTQLAELYLKHNPEANFAVNQEHYEALHAFIKKKGADEETAKAYVEIRKSLDNDLVTVWNTMKEMEDVDEETISEYRRSLNQVQNYFPHKRYGNHYIQVINPKEIDEDTGKAKVLYREHFSSPKTTASVIAKRKLKKLLQQYPEFKKYKIQAGKVSSLSEEVYEMPIPIEALEQVVNAAVKRISDPETQKTFQQMLPQATADVLKSRGWASHAIQRKNIPGHETENIQKVLFDYKAGLYGWLTKMSASKDFSTTLADVDAATKQNLYGAMKNYAYDMLANSDEVDRAVAAAKSVFFAKYLGANIKTAVLNLTQNLIAGAPRLGMETGGGYMKWIKGAGKQLNAYYRRQKNLSDDQLKLLNELLEEGTTQANYIEEVMGQFAGGPKSAWNKLVKFLGIPMMVAEKFNRASLALAAFDAATAGKITNKETLKALGLKKGEKASYRQAKEFAQNIVDDAHFVYGKANRPEIFRGSNAGKVANTAYTFRTFTHNLVNLWRHMWQKGGPGKRAVMKSLAATIAIGGISSIPLYKTFMHVVRQLSGDDWEEDAILEHIPEDANWLRDIIVYGFPAIAGVNIGGSVGMELPVFERIRVDDSFVDQLWSGTGEILGIPGAILEDAESAIQAINSGQGVRAFEYLLPVGFANVFKGYRMKNEGLYTRSGRPIVLPGESQPQGITTREMISKMLGFQPTSVQKGWNLSQKLSDLQAYKTTTQRDFADRLANAIHKRDQAKANKIVGEIQAWNLEQIEKGRPEYLIDIKNSLRSRMNGRQPPKYMRPKAMVLKNRMNM